MNAIVRPAPLRGPAFQPSSHLRRILRLAGLFLGAFLAAAVLGGGYLAYEVQRFHEAHEGLLLPGAAVAGIDVSGLTPEQAAAAVDAVIGPELEQTVTVRHGERSWSRTAEALGSGSDVEDVLAAVVAASESAEWSDLFDMRWRDTTLGLDEPVAVHHTDGPAREWITEIAAEVDAEPRNAVLDTSTGWVKVIRGSYGLRTLVDDTAALVVDALHGSGQDDIELVTEDVVPEVTSADFDEVLLVRHDEHRLYRYKGGAITHSWPVALGAAESGYPTPKGIFEVTLKRRSPTWVNPDPTGWGADMPAQVPPGPDNPLGERAINWSVGAIRFHGTANESSIGTNASKGCVRLTNADVIELFDLVSEGAAIVSH